MKIRQLQPPMLKMIVCGGATTGPPDEESPTASLMTNPSQPSRCHVPYLLLLKQLGWRMRSRWRHYLLRRRRCNNAALRFSYDLRSYSLNFDDGRRCVQDPFAP